MPAKGQRIPLETRFWRYVAKGKKRACWPWTGHRDADGYGRIMVRVKTKRGHTVRPAHRVAYGLFVGPVPNELLVLHKCNNPCCVNPNHLRLGTPLENMADRSRSGNTLRGEMSPVAKLTAKDIRAIRRDTRYQYVIAKDYGIIQAHVSRIKRRTVWSHIP